MYAYIEIDTYIDRYIAKDECMDSRKIDRHILDRYIYRYTYVWIDN
jgi:hypothetical protein